MKYSHFPDLFPDEYEIGQKKVAQIRKEIAVALMAESYKDAFSTGYINELWRAMRRRQFNKGRAEYERAKQILEAVQ